MSNASLLLWVLSHVFDIGERPNTSTATSSTSLKSTLLESVTPTVLPLESQSRNSFSYSHLFSQLESHLALPTRAEAVFGFAQTVQTACVPCLWPFHGLVCEATVRQEEVLFLPACLQNWTIDNSTGDSWSSRSPGQTCMVL